MDKDSCGPKNIDDVGSSCIYIYIFISNINLFISGLNYLVPD